MSRGSSRVRILGGGDLGVHPQISEIRTGFRVSVGGVTPTTAARSSGLRQTSNPCTRDGYAVRNSSWPSLVLSAPQNFRGGKQPTTLQCFALFLLRLITCKFERRLFRGFPSLWSTSLPRGMLPRLLITALRACCLDAISRRCLRCAGVTDDAGP